MSTNHSPQLFALTPIEQTEGLEDGIYTVIDKEGNKKDYYYSNDYFINSEGDEGFHKHCGDGKFYLRPAPDGSILLTETEIADLIYSASPLSVSPIKAIALAKQFIQTKLAQKGARLL